MKRVLVTLLSVLIFSSCSMSSKTKSDSTDINTLADQYISNMFYFSPELSTYYGIEYANHRELSDISPNGVLKTQLAEDNLYRLLSNLNVEALSSDDLITYSLLKEALKSSINARVCKRHLWTINQMDSIFVWFRYIADTQPIDSKNNKSDAIYRWKELISFIKQDIDNNRVGLQTGYALPEVVIIQVIEQINMILEQKTEDTLFYIPAQKSNDAEFQLALKSIIEKELFPVISEYKYFLENEYLPKARPKLSISSIPNGVECYEALLSQSTTLPKRPDDIFKWGVDAISHRKSKILSIGKKIYNETTIKNINNAFKADKSNYFESKDEIILFVKDAINRSKLLTGNYINLIPQADVIVEPISQEEEATGFSRYLPASDDGKRAAKYIQQTFQPKTKIKGEAESTAFHETYPGHHLQIAISRELVNSHPIVKYVRNSGFSEGWARYAELLSDELGLYSSDKNRLAMYMGLPTGMVVDPGIHLKNWTREEAIEYTLNEQASMTRKEAEMYVDRISVLPGQMTTYGVGEMYFLKLRKSAENKLGDKFDLKEFHDVCLKYGSVPLNFINGKVEEWIESKSI
ncbi:MAG: DUF885 domain-containing protein [Methylococcales bacterium]